MKLNIGAPFKTWLEQRNPRERQLLGLVAAVLILALLWWVAIAPALQTYRQSNEAHAKLDLQMADMQKMATEAKKLRATPRVGAAQARAWLEGATKKLNAANLTAQGGRIQVSFAGVPAETLASWLAEARTAAQLLPVEATWKKTSGATNPLWDGNLVFELPK